MLIIQENIKPLLEQKVHRFCTCWRITRKDGVILRFTDHSNKLTFGGETFTPVGGFSASARSKSGDFGGRDLELFGSVTSSAILSTDLREGRYNNATLDEYQIDWRYPWAGEIQHSKYIIRTTKYSNEQWEATIESIMSELDLTVGEVYSRNCKLDLGDAKCKVNIAALKASNASVDSVVDRLNFTASHATFAGKALDYWKFGLITWKSGSNINLTTEVRSSTVPSGNACTFSLQLRTVLDIVASDTFDITPGCEKTETVCKSKFNNYVNFRGYTFIPGSDRALRTPDP